MATVTVKVEKKSEQEVHIPVPSYWRPKRPSTNFLEAVAIITEKHVVKIWIANPDSKDAQSSVSILPISSVTEFAHDDLEQVQRPEFDMLYVKATDIQKAFLKWSS